MPIGGGKGGSDFDPRGRSDGEIMRFCQSFMTELYRHLGEYTDVPAGDIGVGGREIGYMFGQYKRLTNRYEAGVLTGKGLAYGGSRARTEATGYGAVYFVERMLKTRGQDFDGKRVVVSGSGNVAIYTIEKILELRRQGRRLLGLQRLCRRRGRHRSGAAQGDQGSAPRAHLRLCPSARATARITSRGGSIWDVPCDIAMPSATQNELTGKDAQTLIKNGVIAVGEGANMPSHARGGSHFPARPASCSARARRPMPAASPPRRWRCSRTPRATAGPSRRPRSGSPAIMRNIHDSCAATADEYGAPGNYVLGANIAGFVRVAEAMRALGVI